MNRLVARPCVSNQRQCFRRGCRRPNDNSTSCLYGHCQIESDKRLILDDQNNGVVAHNRFLGDTALQETNRINEKRPNA